MTKRTPDGGTTESSLSASLDALSHTYRRRILAAVATANPRDEDQVTPIETADEDESLELFEMQLYHIHLPKLDEAGFVNWNRETGTVTGGPRFDEIQPLLTLITDHQAGLRADCP